MSSERSRSLGCSHSHTISLAKKRLVRRGGAHHQREASSGNGLSACTTPPPRLGKQEVTCVVCEKKPVRHAEGLHMLLAGHGLASRMSAGIHDQGSKTQKQLNERLHMSFLKRHEGFIYELLFGAMIGAFVAIYFTN